MTDKPLVSIIIPLYNAEPFVADAINSCLGQTYKHIEIIVVNDGSSDNSLAVAQSFQVQNLKVIDQENAGASAARNVGLRNAKGKYIQFLDADDLLSKNKIEVQVKSLEEMGEDTIAYCATRYFFDGENPSDSKINEYDTTFLNFSNDPITFMTNLWGGYSNCGGMIQPNAWLTPKKLIEKSGTWNEDITVDDDGEFFARVVLNSKELVFSDRIYNYYRKFKGQVSLSMRKSEVAYQSILNSTLSKKKTLISKTHSTDAKIAIYRLLMELAIQCYGEYAEIYKACIKELPKITYPYDIIVGGHPLVKLTSKHIHWKLAKRLQLLSRFLKRSA